VKKAQGNPVPASLGCYLGEFEYAVDAQRRLAIPGAWRAADGGFVLLPGREQSLQLVPAAMFQELLAKLRQVSFADAQAAVALATIGSMAVMCEPDKQGRISLTPKLMEHAGIRGAAVLLGAVTTIQIWEPARWEARRMNSQKGLDVLQALQEKPDALGAVLGALTKGKA
jgi:MraZ protein